MTGKRPDTLLVLSHMFVPDPGSVGQHMADVAAEMADRGSRVVVYTANRGYDDPTVRYPKREHLGDVEVRRFPFSSFGKRSLAHRLLGQLSFVLQCIVRGIATRGLRGVLITTSPPVAPLAGLAIRVLRRVPVTYWVMDLNPDQAIALGVVKPESLAARLIDALNRRMLARAARVVTLDRFMAERVQAKEAVDDLVVMPPWPHEQVLEPVSHADNPFRALHGLTDKTVIMYSGNMSISHPLTTLLAAALRLQDRDDLAFLFIGGGLAKQEVEEAIARHRPANMRTLPYQPLDQLRWSLSAADVHVVAMGDHMVGCVHPCKAYGAMAVARPILLLGPAECHIADLFDHADIGWRVAHGDVDGMVRTLESIAASPDAELAARGAQAQRLVRERLAKDELCRRMGDVVESTLPRNGSEGEASEGRSSPRPESSRAKQSRRGD